MTFAISCNSTPAPYDLILLVALGVICLFLIIPTTAALGAAAKRVGIVAGALSRKSEAISRGARMLRTALGPAIAVWLEDPAVVEVMLNPDGRLWVDRLTEGLQDTGERLSAADGERIVRLVAHHVGAEVHPTSPRLSAELPETGERFE